MIEELIIILQNLDPNLTLPLSTPITGVNNFVFFLQHVLRHYLKISGFSKPKIVITKRQRYLASYQDCDFSKKSKESDFHSFEESQISSSQMHENPEIRIFGAVFNWGILHIEDALFRVILTNSDDKGKDCNESGFQRRF